MTTCVFEKYSKAVFRKCANLARTSAEVPVARERRRTRSGSRRRRVSDRRAGVVSFALRRTRLSRASEGSARTRLRRAHLLTLRVPSARVLTKAPTSTRDEAPVRGEERQAAAAVDRRRHRLGARNPRPQDRSARRTTADLKSLDFPRDVVDFLSSRRSALTSRSLLARASSLTNAARRSTIRSNASTSSSRNTGRSSRSRAERDPPRKPPSAAPSPS